jgi:hypothetical protein
VRAGARRWTIGGALGLIALLAVGMAALRDSECEWAEIAPGVALGTLLIAAALAILRRGRDRACLAFAAIGGAYFLAAWPIGPIPRRVPIASTVIERIVLEFDAVTNPPPPIRHQRWFGAVGRAALRNRPKAEYAAIIREMNVDGERDRRWENHRPWRLMFGRKIAHAWLSLALGSLAAIAAALIFGRRSRYDDCGRVSGLREDQPDATLEGAADGEPHVSPCP